MKAILILDEMPENCMKCPLRFNDGDTDDWFRFRCRISTDQIPKEGRLCNCPLKPMPVKKVPAFNPNDCDMQEEIKIIREIEGYNRCLDEILGEKE